VSEFTGFPKQTFEYLAELSQQNNREWFTARRNRYETYYLEPALAFIEALGPRLATELPGDVRFEPRVNGSLFRINRDVRFSKDKTPYKDHIDMWFWQGERKGWETPGYFMRLEAHQWAIGAGMHHLDKDGMEAYRAAVTDGRQGRALEGAVAKLEGTGLELGGSTRKSLPRGYDAAHPRSAYLLHEGLFAIHYGPVPAQAHTPAFVETCLGYFKAASPINGWLAKALQREGR
jgi:uncharacterized protein (TIGR02453 family)